MTSVWQGKARKPRVPTEKHGDIRSWYSPYSLNKIRRRENNIRWVLIEPFQFGFSEILQAGVSISLPKPAALWQPKISWLQQSRQIRYSYPVNSHDSSNQLLISIGRYSNHRDGPYESILQACVSIDYTASRYIHPSQEQPRRLRLHQRKRGLWFRTTAPRHTGA